MKRKNLLFGACVVLVIFLILAGLGWSIFRRVFRKPIPVQIDSARPVVALTFDDGPNARYTPQVLDLLYEHQVPATFFLVGEKFAGNELLLQEMAASGHELESHTFSHPDLTTLNREQIQQEIQKTQTALKEILPDACIQSVRPPYGRYTQEVEQAIPYPLVLWTIDSGDWDDPDAQKICTTVVNSIQDGDIVVFHDDNAETVAALDKIISELKARDFQFATVSQLSER